MPQSFGKMEMDIGEVLLQNRVNIPNRGSGVIFIVQPQYTGVYIGQNPGYTIPFNRLAPFFHHMLFKGLTKVLGQLQKLKKTYWQPWCFRWQVLTAQWRGCFGAGIGGGQALMRARLGYAPKNHQKARVH